MGSLHLGSLIIVPYSDGFRRVDHSLGIPFDLVKKVPTDLDRGVGSFKADICTAPCIPTYCTQTALPSTSQESGLQYSYEAHG